MTNRFVIDTPCQIKLKKNSRPKILSVHRFAYEHETKVIEYLDHLANKFFLDVSKYSEIHIELIKDEDTKTRHQIIIATSMIHTEDIPLASIPDTQDTMQDQTQDQENITQKTTVHHDFYQVDTEDSTQQPKIEIEPEETRIEIKLDVVKDWVIQNARIGKPAKYTDAISLFGQKAVDTAITQNLIFNFRGFLEEN